MWQGRSKKPFFTPPTTPPTGEYICRLLFIPASKEALELVNGVLSLLTNIENFTETESGMTAERTAVMFTEMWLGYLGVFQTMIGAIVPMLVETLPGAFLWCDGSTYLRENFPQLYAALPAAFIVDADTFTVPDLRNLFVVGAGDDYEVGDTGGEAEHTLTTTEMPVHSHGYSSAAANLTTIGVGAPEATAVPFPSVTDTAGSGGAHNNMPPYFALRFAIVAKWKECC